MTRAPWTIALAVVLALPAAACSGDAGSAPESVRLRFDYDEGDTLAYEYHASGIATLPDTTEAGEPTEHPFERTLRITEVATDVTPRGHYMLDLVYHLEPDSVESEKGHPGRIALEVEITSRGRIIDVTGVETAGSLFGGIDFQSYFEQSQPVFPDRALKVGDSWTQEVKVVSPTSEPVVTSSTYVLESLVEEEGRTLAVIAYDGDIYLPVQYPARADSATGEDASVDRTTSIEERISVSGKIYFDHEAGVMRRMESTAEATFTRIGFRDGQPVRRDMRIREESSMRLLSR